MVLQPIGIRMARDTVSTRRLLLRPPTVADAPAVSRQLSDFEIARWLARVPFPFGEADAVGYLEAKIDEMLSGRSLCRALELKGSPGHLVGIVIAHGLGEAAECGFWLARDHWGRGLMGEALAALLALVDDLKPQPEMRSGAFVGNDASLAVQQRCGFVVTGMSRRHCTALGHARDHVDTVRILP